MWGKYRGCGVRGGAGGSNFGLMGVNMALGVSVWGVWGEIWGSCRQGLDALVAMATPGSILLPLLPWKRLERTAPPPSIMATPANQPHHHGNRSLVPAPWLLWQHLSIKPIAMATSPSHPPGCYGSTCQSNPSLWQPVPLPHLLLPWQPASFPHTKHHNAASFPFFFNFLVIFTPKPPPERFHLPPPNTFASS